MNDYIFLQSVTPDDGGIFTALNNFSVPWKDVVSPELIDLQYYGNVSGEKIIAPLVYKQLNSDGKLTVAKQALIASMIFSMFGTNWTKEWNTLSMQYDPIANYDMTEVMTDDETVTDYGKTNTRTNNLTHAKTGTETDAPSVSVTTDDTVHGFNSSDAVPTDGRSQSTSGSDVTTFNTSDTDTGTVTDVGSGSDTSTRNYELTRKGNIGVTSSQQLLQSERDLWVWNYFLDVVFPDVDKIMTIPIYAEETGYSPSGVVPTGTINIIENGLQIDISRYEFADVMVPNTYTEEDQGKVVSGDTLVSQTSRTITENNTYDTTTNNSINVMVPNTYTEEDQGKVVSGDDLVSQTSRTITENNTYDTTTNNSIIVNVPIPLLTGSADPDNNYGENGDIYLKTKHISQYTSILHLDDVPVVDSCNVSSWNLESPAVIDSSRYKFGTGSLYAGTVSASGYIHSDTENVVNILNGDFTIDFWVYMTSNGYRPLISIGKDNTYCFFLEAAMYGSKERLRLFLSNNGTTWNIANAATSTKDFSWNAWHHIAVTKTSNYIHVFTDGVKCFSVDVSNVIFNYDDNYKIKVCSCFVGSSDTSNVYPGYIDELHIIKGLSVWESDFTPPNAPYTTPSQPIIQADVITDTYLKVNNVWSDLIGSDIADVNI